MLVYTKAHVAVPSSLVTVGTVAGVIIAPLALLRLTGAKPMPYFEVDD
jgi:hypothetical protein